MKRGVAARELIIWTIAILVLVAVVVFLPPKLRGAEDFFGDVSKGIFGQKGDVLKLTEKQFGELSDDEKLGGLGDSCTDLSCEDSYTSSVITYNTRILKDLEECKNKAELLEEKVSIQ